MTRDYYLLTNNLVAVKYICIIFTVLFLSCRHNSTEIVTGPDAKPEYVRAVTQYGTTSVDLRTNTLYHYCTTSPRIPTEKEFPITTIEKNGEYLVLYQEKRILIITKTTATILDDTFFHQICDKNDNTEVHQ